MGFIVERKHKQTITTIVLPIFALGWLSMLAILIPLNSGEKIGFLGQFLNACTNIYLFFSVKNIESYNWIGFGIYNGNLGYKYGTSWSWFQTSIYLLGSFDKSRDFTWDFCSDFILPSSKSRWVASILAD